MFRLDEVAMLVGSRRKRYVVGKPDSIADLNGPASVMLERYHVRDARD